MRTAATAYILSTTAMGCLTFAMVSIDCGGASGERPSGTGGGGTAGTSDGGAGGGGGAVGTGGSSSSAVLDCPNAAVVPADGFVTDFSEWNNPNGRWGVPTGLYGAIYPYAGSTKSQMAAKVEGEPKGLHLTGGVAANDYGGGGLSFYVCSNVTTFTQVQFSIHGTFPGCDLELQIQTFDQRPGSQTPAGGCADSCYNFPVMKNVAVSTETATVITKKLADFSNWSEANAKQVVGLQWQFTGTAIDSDGGNTTCPINVTIQNIKFLP